jgi:hypothetical protein
MKFKVGDTFKAKIPYGNKPMKVHICYVLPSTEYDDRTLIVYKVYSKHSQLWHELMCTEYDMEHYVKMVAHFE